MATDPVCKMEVDGDVDCTGAQRQKFLILFTGMKRRISGEDTEKYSRMVHDIVKNPENVV